MALSAKTALPLHPRLQTSYPTPLISYLLPLHPHHRLMLLDVPLCPCFLFALTPSGFFNGMLGVSDQGILKCFTLFHLILLTLFVSRNLTLISLPLSRFLDSLLCVLIVPTSGLAFFLLMPRTLAVVSSFSSGRAYPFLNFLPPLFLCLTPTLIM